MKEAQQKAAILAFVGDPRREVRRKGALLGRASRTNERIWRRLNTRLRAVLGRTGLPVIWLDELQQQGATFGQRLTNGMAMAFAQGYTSLLVVGNDCPQLQSHHLQRAAAALQVAPWVLGPDQRGGAYLIGVRREAFAPVAWLGLPWQTDGLLDALLGLAEEGETVLLPAESDLNAAADLLRLFPRLSPAHILKRLLGPDLLAPRPGRPLGVFRPHFRSRSGLSWRGPPAVA
ncbi:MAG: DUF2064 domain-containing protein [Lewinella sp.]|nr:DUF2064 domain-containing protein [Lewinella sp.]